MAWLDSALLGFVVHPVMYMAFMLTVCALVSKTWSEESVLSAKVRGNAGEICFELFVCGGWVGFELRWLG